MMKSKDKIEFILTSLYSHGSISRAGAADLSTVAGLVELLQQETLSRSTRQRPVCPSLDSKLSFGGHHSSQQYRRRMVYYLKPWIIVPEILTWPTYETLANYCEAKARKK